MRVCVAVMVIPCPAAAGVSGCSHDEACGVADFGGRGSDYQTARQALNSVLAQHPPGLSVTG